MDWTYYYLRCQEEDLLHFTVKQKTPWTHYFSFFFLRFLVEIIFHTYREDKI